MRRSILYEILLPLFLLIGISVIFWISRADIMLLRPFYSEEKGWFLGDNLPWVLLYRHGVLPGLLIGVASLLVLIAGFLIKSYAAYRQVALFFILCLALGPGLITNTLLKDHWGRPRPLQVKEFGGSEPFRKAWVKTDFKDGRSFPSGHASIGFFLLTPFFVLRKIRGRWAVAFLALGLFYGSLMGLGRMVQGSHFPSDVLWAAGIVYFNGFFLAYIFGFYRKPLMEKG